MRKKVKTIGAAALALVMTVSVMPGDVGKAYTPGNYSYDDEYTLGWKNGIVAYQDGVSKSLEKAGVTVFDKKDDRPFQSEIEQEWDADVITLTQPVKYTTEDGVAHDVESMLTNFNFIADPTAIDNSEVDGKLYVYGTTEGFSYNNGVIAQNGYNNHSLTILSTSDMVNWTDEGFMDTQNLTNEVSDSDNKVKAEWAVKAWAPSGLAYDGDGDGQLEYYLFHTNSGAVGYVMSDSPTGPWRSPLRTTLFSSGSPGCKGVKWCFDPAVLRDSNGDAYIYFGGGIWDQPNETAAHPDGIAHPKTGRVCKLGFDENGEVFADGEPQEMDTYYLFEDSEINQFNGKYYYSYCVNFKVPNGDPWVKSGSIAVYVSSDPMDIAFDPAAENGTQYTDGNGVYHHFLGTILDNPSIIYGESYNNHHHMQSFKGRDYIFYHSTVLHNSIHRINKQYRNLHVDEINVDPDTDEVLIEPSYEGAEQIEHFNPYTDNKGNAVEINATTTSYSAGVCSRRSDSRVLDGLSPMVLDEIDTGDWTKIQGVDFGDYGTKKFEATVASETDDAAIEIFIDDPTKASNLVGTLSVRSTGDQDVFETISADLNTKVWGVHDVYFVFRGTDYDVAAWKFTRDTELVVKPTSVPTPDKPVVTPSPAPAPTSTPAPAPDYNKTYKIGKLNYKAAANGTAMVKGPVKKTDKSVQIPASVTIGGKSYKVTSVAANAFKGCKKLSSVTIGGNVNKIGAKAFFGCKALKKITVKSSVIKSVGGNAFKGTASRLTIKVPKKKTAAYKKMFKGKGQGKRARIK